MKVIWAACSVLVAAVIFSAGCTGTSDGPSIDYQGSNPDFIELNDSFDFRDAGVSISFYVDKNLYEAAKSTDKSVWSANESPEDWSPAYYRSYVGDGDMDAVYDSILAALGQVRESMSLDDDGYADLISVYVQSIPYETDDAIVSPRFPVEIVYENAGDCDDKSILLAGLLSKAGYNVSLLMFPDESHMNVGISAPGCEYDSTGYAMIEATDVNLIGWEEIAIGDGLVLNSTPIVIPIGDGVMSYTACDEVKAIYDTYKDTEARCSELDSRINEERATVETLKEEIDEMKSELDTLKSKGSAGAYNALVPSYNAKAVLYNEKARDLEELVKTYNEYAAVHNEIIEKQYDRVGLYEYVTTP